ncbi:hypothetical protein MKK58_06275 [Methylobacterium sp. J-078]|uniref:hypothetical protein n=1 Tax=Methylobacterium sp. J-078 TaxID=2836657 RepID=UPI001FBA10EA|nr:hypothetical protein [Methylobacterium sp. J-078]MCJ2044137.1 hypothetical protein [Methylobacterium sp. J-078]
MQQNGSFAARCEISTRGPKYIPSIYGKKLAALTESRKFGAQQFSFVNRVAQVSFLGVEIAVMGG